MGWSAMQEEEDITLFSRELWIISGSSDDFNRTRSFV
jgi:hypothetical protein